MFSSPRNDPNRTREQTGVLEDPARLFALHATGLIESEPEEAFDRLTRLAARMIGTPMAALSFVDDHRQFIKSSVGLPEPYASQRELPLSSSICKHVVMSNESLIVSDLREDEFFRQHEAVTGAGLVAYAAIPVRSASGAALGCFSVMDTQPRNWSGQELSLLGEIAASVMTEIDLRTDIRRRETVEARLRLSEERFRTIVEAASDIIYDTDEWGRFRYVNPVAERVMGLPQEQLIGMHFTELVRADARVEVEAFYRRQFASRTQSTYYEFPAVSANGSEVWIGQNVRLLLMENGRIRGAQAIARDMTHRRRLERIKDQFVSVVSNQLRNPLSEIRDNLELLAGAQGSSQERETALREALLCTDQVTRLITDLLDLERITSGELRLQVGSHNLKRMLSAAIEAVLPMAAAAMVSIELASTDVVLQVDGDRMVQAWVNLLAHAVAVSPRNSKVRVSARVVERSAIIEVLDQGAGIPESKLGAVFDRFAQTESMEPNAPRATGLGLAIAKSLVEQHGGMISVTSTVGAGSTFRVVLPLLSANRV